MILLLQIHPVGTTGSRNYIPQPLGAQLLAPETIGAAVLLANPLVPKRENPFLMSSLPHSGQVRFCSSRAIRMNSSNLVSHL